MKFTITSGVHLVGWSLTAEAPICIRLLVRSDINTLLVHFLNMNLQDCTYNKLSSKNTLTSSIYKLGYFLRTYRYVQPICLNVQYLPCLSCTKEKFIRVFVKVL